MAVLRNNAPADCYDEVDKLWDSMDPPDQWYHNAVTVDGSLAVTGTVTTALSTSQEICRLMVGRDVELEIAKEAAPEDTDVILSIEGLILKMEKE